jgi:hypothetical protein
MITTIYTIAEAPNSRIWVNPFWILATAILLAPDKVLPAVAKYPCLGNAIWDCGAFAETG